MRKFPIVALLGVAVFGFAACEGPGFSPDAGQAAATPAAPGGRGRGPAVPAGLGQAMTEMNTMLEALKKTATDPAAKEANLKSLATLERDIAISKLMTIPGTGTMPAADQAKAKETFRTMLNTLLRTALDLEDAVVANKADDIKKLIAQLEEIEKKGHTEFHVGE